MENPPEEDVEEQIADAFVNIILSFNQHFQGVCVCVCVGGWVGGCVGVWVCGCVRVGVMQLSYDSHVTNL